MTRLFENGDATLLGEFTIDELPPRASAHWRVIHNAKKKWATHFGWQAAASRIPQAAPGERRIVEIELHRPGVAMDEDNLHARCKVPLDVLSRAHGRKKIGIGVIWDDAPAFLILRPTCVRDRRTFTLVRVLSTDT